MLAVRTKDQPQKITLIGLVAQPRVRIIEEMIIREIKYRDGLVRQALLRSVAVIEQCGIAAIRTEGNRSGKTIRAADLPRGWDGQHFAGRQVDGRAISGRRRLCRGYPKGSEKSEGKTKKLAAGGANHDASVQEPLQNEIEISLMQVRPGGQSRKCDGSQNPMPLQVKKIAELRSTGPAGGGGPPMSMEQA